METSARPRPDLGHPETSTRHKYRSIPLRFAYWKYDINQFLNGHRLFANTHIIFVCTFLPCTQKRPKHCIKEEGRRRRKIKSLVLANTIWWPDVISGGLDYFNYKSKIIIKKYLKSLTANTPGTFGSSVEMGG